MKQDQKPSQVRSSQNEETSKSLFSQIGKSYSLTQNSKNKLIFTSKSLPLIQPIAYSLLQGIKQNSPFSQELILLLDFDPEDIEWLNQCLSLMILTQPLDKKFDQNSRKLLKVTRLNNLTIQKRRVCYIRNGVYAVSCQIFLTDLLRGQATVHPRHISKIIVKFNEKVKNYYHYHAWLCTMIRMKEEDNNNKWNVPFVFICNKPFLYSFQDDLKEVYRILFCQKVMIWPFGRAEIHKKLNQFRQNKSVREWQHSLSHSEGQKQIQTILYSIFKFLKKTLGMKYGDQSKQIEELLYSKIDQESFLATRSQYSEFENIKSLLSQLQNANRSTLLTSIAAYRDENHYDMWNSNNSEAIELTEALIDKLKKGIFWFQKCESMKVDIKSLLESKNSFLGQNQDNYQCIYDLEVKLTLKPDQNEKVNELIKVIQDYKSKCSQKQIPCTNKSSQKEQQGQQSSLKDWQKIQKKLNIQKKNETKKKTILVVCNSKRTLRYVTSNLKSYLSDSGYLQYLLSLQHWLKSESPKRQIIIKRLFDKRKMEVGKDKGAEMKVTPKQKIQESKVILQEILLNQIDKIIEFLLDFELQLSVITEEFKRATNIGAIFDINQEQIKLVTNFQEKLAKSRFILVDVSRIQLTNSRKKTGDIVFQGPQSHVKVVVEYFARTSQLTHFYSLLKVIEPQIIVFYSPSTTLLRSLYLYSAQNKHFNLESLHIITFQDSYESTVIKQQVVKEDKAFWEIAQKRSQLSQYRETPFSRIKKLYMKDEFDKAIHSVGKSMLRNEEEKSSFNLTSLDFSQYRRIVIVDTREFKSSLPSYLFHFGFQVVPMFLKTADYILSDDIAIEKKSVNTKDLQTSLKTQRLQEQIKRMNSTFRHSYILIEFQEQKDVRKDNFGRFQFGKVSRQNSESREIRKKLFQLIHKYDKVRLIWSTSIEQSCHFFKQLKVNKPEPDLIKFQKAETEEDLSTLKLSNISEVSSSKQKDE